MLYEGTLQAAIGRVKTLVRRHWCRPVESKFCELHLIHGAETKDSISSFYVYPFEIVSTEGFTSNTCAAAVLNLR
jgi:hypothetical protein